MSASAAPDGFRLPDATHVGAVTLQVADLERSIDYYTSVIGFRVESRGRDEAALAPDRGTPLVFLRQRRGIQRVPPRGAFGLYHFAILLPDRAALGRFAAHIAAINVRIGMADHLVSEALYLTDPDGLGIEVYADRPRDTWRRVGGELAMTTEPLDIGSVIEAGAGQQWDGAPQGTTMGHIHLHVGSLEQADAFYHGAIGFDRTVWSYPGALFLSAGGYHHHLGTNTWSPGPSATDEQARLLEWELLVPSPGDVDRVIERVRESGAQADRADGKAVASDPWGTTLRLGSRL